MGRLSAALVRRLGGNAIELALQTRDLLQSQQKKTLAVSRWEKGLSKRFPELSPTAIGQLRAKALQSEKAIQATLDPKRKVSTIGSLIPSIEGVNFQTRTSGRIRYQLWVETKNAVRGRSNYIKLNVFSPRALSHATLMSRARAVLAEKIEASPSIHQAGVRDTAEVVGITIVGLLSR